MSAFISSKDLNDEQISEKMGFLQNYKGNPDVVLEVTSKEKYTKGSGCVNLAFIDYGAKSGILRSLLSRNCKVTVFPATVAPNEILGKFDAVFLSNGPGDPQDCKIEIETIKNLVGKIPIFGICLGYQLLALVLGAKTYKLKYGHRGSNHPVIDLKTGRVMMSAQNHGYAVDENSLTKLMKSTYKI
jgi:carbamoyl-phosphate synthase small subunit